MSKHHDSKEKHDPTQAELAAKAMKLKEDAAAQQGLRDEGGPLAPNDPEANPGKGALADTERKTAPSGALDHGGALPAQSRSGQRG